MTDAPRRHSKEELAKLLKAAQMKIEWLEEELRIERYGKQVASRRASWGNGARQ